MVQIANVTAKPHIHATGTIEEKQLKRMLKATELHPKKLKIQVPKNSPKRFLIRINNGRFKVYKVQILL